MWTNMSDNIEDFWMVIYKSRGAEINERDSFSSVCRANQ